MEENTKHQILANDLIRRLGNTDMEQNEEVLGGVIDQFGRKILTSGYSMAQSRKILLNGVRGWERKVASCLKDGKRLYRKAEESLKGRILKKTLGNSSWYRRRRKISDSQEQEPGGAKEDKNESKRRQGDKGKRRGVNSETENVKVAAVLFVENTKEGGLARGLRDVMERLKHILGFSIKIVERSGTPLKLLFPFERSV